MIAAVLLKIPCVLFAVKAPVVNDPATRLMLPRKVQFLHLILKPVDLDDGFNAVEEASRTKTYSLGPPTETSPRERSGGNTVVLM